MIHQSSFLVSETGILGEACNSRLADGKAFKMLISLRKLMSNRKYLLIQSGTQQEPQRLSSPRSLPMLNPGEKLYHLRWHQMAYTDKKEYQARFNFSWKC
jgi:hypothetical protein